ncbi:MAG: hypothetical protein LBE49_07410 [Deltaproteobacteria bacterium]|nr:hypothetical protein [Deltaproteobacteria bacterium]
MEIILSGPRKKRYKLEKTGIISEKTLGVNFVWLSQKKRYDLGKTGITSEKILGENYVWPSKKLVWPS